jgi:hypothetical protein
LVHHTENSSPLWSRSVLPFFVTLVASTTFRLSFVSSPWLFLHSLPRLCDCPILLLVQSGGIVMPEELASEVIITGYHSTGGETRSCRAKRVKFIVAPTRVTKVSVLSSRKIAAERHRPAMVARQFRCLRQRLALQSDVIVVLSRSRSILPPHMRGELPLSCLAKRRGSRLSRYQRMLRGTGYARQEGSQDWFEHLKFQG